MLGGYELGSGLVTCECEYIGLDSLINTSQSFGAISNDQQGFGSMLGEYLIFEEKAQSGYLDNNNNLKTPLYGSLKLKNYSSTNSSFLESFQFCLVGPYFLGWVDWNSNLPIGNIVLMFTWNFLPYYDGGSFSLLFELCDNMDLLWVDTR